MRVLHLTLKRKWFDMIASGEKKEEYREIKPYWQARLCCNFPYVHAAKDFDIVVFKNGYGKNAPEIRVKWLGMSVDYGKKIWGAEYNKEYFVIKLGEKL